MKHLYSLCILLFLAVSLQSQNIIEKHFQKYAEMDDITEVYVAGKLFDMAATIVDEFEEDDDLGNIKDFISNIESFNLIKIDDLENALSVYNDGTRKIGRTHEQLMMVKENDANFSIYVDKYNGIVEELVGIGTDDGDFVVFSLLGQIDLDKIGELISKIDFKNNEATEIIDNRSLNIDEMKIYPNPVGSNSLLNVEMPESLIGGKANFYDMSGTLISTQRITQQLQQFEASELVSGYYMVELQKEGITVKKKVLVTK